MLCSACWVGMLTPDRCDIPGMPRSQQLADVDVVPWPMERHHWSGTAGYRPHPAQTVRHMQRHSRLQRQRRPAYGKAVPRYGSSSAEDVTAETRQVQMGHESSAPCPIRTFALPGPGRPPRPGDLKRDQDAAACWMEAFVAVPDQTRWAVTNWHVKGWVG